MGESENTWHSCNVHVSILPVVSRRCIGWVEGDGEEADTVRRAGIANGTVRPERSMGA